MGMEGGSAVPDDYEIAVDYMDMTNDRHLWARAADARPGLELSVGPGSERDVRASGPQTRPALSVPAAAHQSRRTAHVTNGPTEAANNLIKRIKRIACGFRRFRNYRIRALLYAGRPNWDLLPAITPR